MAAKQLLPATQSRLLLLAVVTTVVLYSGLGGFLVMSMFHYPTVGKAMLLCICIALGYGLWTLHPLARIGTVAFLGLAAVFVLLGYIDPFPSPGSESPPWSIAWVAPSILLLLTLIVLLVINRSQFHARRDAL